MQNHRFCKAERLCSKLLIDNLFSKGNRVVTQFPFRVIWQFVPAYAIAYPAQVMVTVSKRNFAKATQRNTIKRQLRELYRLHKHLLYHSLENRGKKMVLCISFQAKAPIPSAQLKEAFEALVQKLIHQLEKTT